MKTHLMHPDRGFDPQQPLPWNAGDLIDDLELDTLLAVMADGDHVLYEIGRVALLTPLQDPAEIRYRQAALEDCLRHREIVTEIYAGAVAAIAREKRIFGSILRRPTSVVSRSVEVLEMFVEHLTRLRVIADERSWTFRSAAFTTFFEMIATELDDQFFATAGAHLRRLRFRDGVLMSAELGTGNTGTRYTLRRPHHERGTWLERLTAPPRQGLTFVIPDRDDAGFSALSELRDQGLDHIAHALSRSTDHILAFFKALRTELGFYIGCLNLHDQLGAEATAWCFPEPVQGSVALSCRDLRDAALVLTTEEPVVGNDVDADGRSLVMITGANQGGKSTFLRAVGLAQLMMQSGMFVTAQQYRANVCEAIATHFSREEDPTMTSGRLDEELRRMSDIADHIRPGSLLLCNESFASTNEREGSQISRDILRALQEEGIKVFFVTHLFDLAHGIARQGRGDTLCLRAEREADGHRTFKLPVGEPLPTSYGTDLYARVFGTAAGTETPPTGETRSGASSRRDTR
ncbi:MutS-related protein [Georgenia muralis]|uniref:MutS-like protein n=1 Tax=Georgenia muralis TaxID=154117 RepID=A0A3N4Z9V4_9MICO|nr:DNA mismatch repair protein MutS [Georgenia muralis]RPF28030.1 MutS-like protein [Georgenia muralis]